MIKFSLNLYQVFTGTTTTTSNSTKTGSTPVAAEKVGSIKINGETHSMVVDEDGTIWDYNENTNVWTKRDDSENLLQFSATATSSTAKSSYYQEFNLNDIKTNSVSILRNLQNTTETHSLTNSDLVNYSSAKNTSTAAVIDDFDSQESVINEKSNTYVDIGVSHGTLTSSLIESKNSSSSKNVQAVSYDLGSGYDFSKILASLNSIENENNDDEKLNDIKQINMSIESAYTLAGLGLENSGITTSTLTENRTTIEQVLIKSGNSILAQIMDKIDDLAEEGVKIYIAAGNSADDGFTKGASTEAISTTYGLSVSDLNCNGIVDSDDMYNLYKSYDKNNDGVVTGRELGVFNLLDLANDGNKDNVFVVGSTTSVSDQTSYGNKIPGIADYSNVNDLVDTYADGDIKISTLTTNSTLAGSYTTVSGNTTVEEYVYNCDYGLDINGDGNTDINVTTTGYKTKTAVVNDNNAAGDCVSTTLTFNATTGKYDDIYGFDEDRDGKADAYITTSNVTVTSTTSQAGSSTLTYEGGKLVTTATSKYTKVYYYDMDEDGNYDIVITTTTTDRTGLENGDYAPKIEAAGYSLNDAIHAYGVTYYNNDTEQNETVTINRGSGEVTISDDDSGNTIADYYEQATSHQHKPKYWADVDTFDANGHYVMNSKYESTSATLVTGPETETEYSRVFYYNLDSSTVISVTTTSTDETTIDNYVQKGLEPTLNMTKVNGFETYTVKYYKDDLVGWQTTTTFKTSDTQNDPHKTDWKYDSTSATSKTATLFDATIVKEYDIDGDGTTDAIYSTTADDITEDEVDDYGLSYIGVDDPTGAGKGYAYLLVAKDKIDDNNTYDLGAGRDHSTNNGGVTTVEYLGASSKTLICKWKTLNSSSDINNADEVLKSTEVTKLTDDGIGYAYSYEVNSSVSGKADITFTTSIDDHTKVPCKTTLVTNTTTTSSSDGTYTVNTVNTYTYGFDVTGDNVADYTLTTETTSTTSTFLTATASQTCVNTTKKLVGSQTTISGDKTSVVDEYTYTYSYDVDGDKKSDGTITTTGYVTTNITTATENIIDSSATYFLDGTSFATPNALRTKTLDSMA